MLILPAQMLILFAQLPILSAQLWTKSVLTEDCVTR